ncbi:hypothetical protein GCM10007036_12680 [Alsobacter metallidurans]|uniref:Uncharacterized protein n=1 Tax=Alsobacter metallidurans TaxID=340221 RepID=A0A917I4L4_9HYPH|nr:hypothetical protein [Alsobacter metallidurans]GGH13817.1 hypothetical protein GCM10007036_12680 [Alsobacter metallidurans]
MTLPANTQPNSRGSLGPDAPDSLTARRSPGDHPPPSRKEALLSRLWAAAETQVTKIEQRSRDIPGGGNLEHEAKALAVLCRVLKELPTEDDIARDKARAEPEIDDGDRDADEFREELARHLSRIAREREAELALERGEPGDPAALDDAVGPLGSA